MTGKSPNIRSIIDFQITRWFIKEKGSPEDKKTRQPLIIISRQRGSGGLTVAKRLSQRLGWPYYDKNIIKEIANTVGADEKQLTFLDEKDRAVFRKFLNVFRRDPEVSQDEYVQYLERFLKTLHEVGGSIILGRGAEGILLPDTVLRVRIMSELERRAHYAAGKYGLDEQQAYKVLKTWDQEKKKFVKRHFNKDIDDPAQYDLVINTSYLDLDNVAELIIAAYRLKFPGVI
jgi:cytidylate kinase